MNKALPIPCQSHALRNRFCIGLLFAILTSIFIFSVHLRSPYFGHMANGYFEDQTARTLKFSRNWYRDGAWNDKFFMLENPASVEFGSLQERIPYLSFLPGVVAITYVASLVLGDEPSIATIHICNLLTQYLSALSLALCAWLLMEKRQKFIRFIAALVTGTSYILTPYLLYEHQQVYFTDSAMMLPFSALLLCIALNAHLPRRMMDWITASVMLLFILCDWLGAIAAFLWFILRWFEYRRQPLKAQIISLWPVALPSLLCLGFFTYQLWASQLINMVINAMLYRNDGSALGVTTAASRIGVFIDRLAVEIYGPLVAKLILMLGVYTCIHICISGFIYLYAATRRGDINSRALAPLEWARMQVAIICALAPLISVYLFPDHFFYHNFSAIRFAPAVFLGIFCLFPELVNDLIRWKKPWFHLIIYSIFTLASYGYFWSNLYQRPFLGWFEVQNYSYYEVSDFLYNNSKFNDIIFSPNYETPFKHPTQNLAVAMKRVYPLVNFIHIKTYGFNDFADPLMLYYNMPQLFEVRLPTESSTSYLLVIKSDNCWPLSNNAADFLRTEARVLYENNQFVYYALPQPEKLINTPICRE